MYFLHSGSRLVALNMRYKIWSCFARLDVKGEVHSIYIIIHTSTIVTN